MRLTTPSGATLFGGLPSSTLFSVPTGQEPLGIPPPLPGSNSSAFQIPDHIYTAVLNAKVPITIAALYAVTVTLLNRYNASNGKRPWAISKTKPFRIFVIVHNLFLAIYSAWTFWGMLGGMRRSVVSPTGPHGLAATADSLCQVNGPAGFGYATVYSDTLGQWTSFSGPALLDSDGAPSRQVYGRLWNEGLAFYGWIFYLSKFYEVLDTFIILAKGKLSSTLQTYHHAGAMMCMWAGMRYMSAPIWIFVLVNSFIHALMVRPSPDPIPPLSLLLPGMRRLTHVSLVHLLHPNFLQNPNPDPYQALLDHHANHAVRLRRLLRHATLFHLLHHPHGRPRRERGQGRRLCRRRC